MTQIVTKSLFALGINGLKAPARGAGQSAVARCVVRVDKKLKVTNF